MAKISTVRPRRREGRAGQTTACKPRKRKVLDNHATSRAALVGAALRERVITSRSQAPHGASSAVLGRGIGMEDVAAPAEAVTQRTADGQTLRTTQCRGRVRANIVERIGRRDKFIPIDGAYDKALLS